MKMASANKTTRLSCAKNVRCYYIWESLYKNSISLAFRVCSFRVRFYEILYFMVCANMATFFAFCTMWKKLSRGWRADYKLPLRLRLPRTMYFRGRWSWPSCG